jgi:hypothetical protein
MSPIGAEEVEAVVIGYPLLRKYPAAKYSIV